VKHHIIVARVLEAEAGLERIKHLEVQLAAAPVNSLGHRTLSAAIRIEADAYRKSLDVEQAEATHDEKPHFAVGPVARPSLISRKKQTLVPRRRIASGAAPPRR
jgi:hypothetical protein